MAKKEESTETQVALKDGWFTTPDGRKFNTRNKALKYLQELQTAKN